MLIVGDSEQERGEISVRRHREGDEGSATVAELAARAAAEVAAGRSGGPA
jgi:threonyl-tRNA synthetase